MSLIRDYINRWVLGRSCDASLDNLQGAYGDDLVRRFNLLEPTSSYWIECVDDYAKAPEIVNEEAEFQGSVDSRSDFIVERCSFFPESVRDELKGIFRYVLYLRDSTRNHRIQFGREQDEVRDNVYEM